MARHSRLGRSQFGRGLLRNQCQLMYTLYALEYNNVYISLLFKVNRIAEFWRIAAVGNRGRYLAPGIKIPGIQQ
jgi:hypothetical protein